MPALSAGRGICTTARTIITRIHQHRTSVDVIPTRAECSVTSYGVLVVPPDETRVAKVEPRIRSSLFKNSFFLLYSALVFFFVRMLPAFYLWSNFIYIGLWDAKFICDVHV